MPATNNDSHVSRASRRHAMRLNGYDYAQPGAYFITVCTAGRTCLLGHIADGHVILSGVGRIVHRVWTELSDRRPGVDIDTFVIMPNHLHAIVVLTGNRVHHPATATGSVWEPTPTADHQSSPIIHGDTIRGHSTPFDYGVRESPIHRTNGSTSEPSPTGKEARGGDQRQSISLPEIVRRFKTLTTRECSELLTTQSNQSGRIRLWQRNYYEHVIRDENALERVRQYIIENPLKWELDEENPERHP